MSVIRCVFGHSTAIQSAITCPFTRTICLQVRLYTKRWQRKSFVSGNSSSTSWLWIADVVAFQQWSPTCFINDNLPIVMTSLGKLNMVYDRCMCMIQFSFTPFIDDGSCNEIYTEKPAPYMIGEDFGYVAWVSVYLYFTDWDLIFGYTRLCSKNVKLSYLPSRHMLLIETNMRFCLIPAMITPSSTLIYVCTYQRAQKRSEISSIWYV